MCYFLQNHTKKKILKKLAKCVSRQNKIMQKAFLDTCFRGGAGILIKVSAGGMGTKLPNLVSADISIWEWVSL